MSALLPIYLTDDQDRPEIMNARQTMLQGITGVLRSCVFQVASGQSVAQALRLSRRVSVI